MSCIIERLACPHDVLILRVSGHISGEHVETLKALIEHEHCGVAIDLGDVIFVDREAVKLLALSEMKGIALRNCPALIREQVNRERA